MTEVNHPHAGVGIVMGSQSDWATMQRAAETLDALGVPHEATDRLRPPHARAAVRLSPRARPGRGPQGDHRRRRRRGAPAGHGSRR